MMIVFFNSFPYIMGKSMIKLAVFQTKNIYIEHTINMDTFIFI